MFAKVTLPGITKECRYVRKKITPIKVLPLYLRNAANPPPFGGAFVPGMPVKLGNMELLAYHQMDIMLTQKAPRFIKLPKPAPNETMFYRLKILPLMKRLL